jgi:hypothetical protein
MITSEQQLKLNDIISRHTAIVKAHKDLQADYWNYITDKSVPLMDRWEVYVRAPDELKEHDDYIVEFDSPFLQSLFDVADGCLGRHDTIYIHDKICHIIYDGIIDLYGNDLQYEYTEADVHEAMEELLECNLLSFINDW